MTTTEKTLQALALLDPDFPAFAAALTSEELQIANSALPEGLAEDVTTLLRTERPELSGWLDAQPSTQPKDKLAVDPLAAAGVLAAILFLLRSHIKFKGKHFTFEHKPMESELLKAVLNKLSLMFGGTSEP